MADRSRRLLEERVAWIVSEIVGIIEASKHLRLDWCNPQYVQGLIDLAEDRKVYRTSGPGPKWTNVEWE